MEDFNSKYTGEEVEQLLDQVANGEVGGETLTESDIANMGFTKNVGTITEVKMNGVSKGTSGVVDLGDVQTPISDLEIIREGAAKGATSVQPSEISEFLTADDLASVATSGSYNDLVDQPTIPSAVTESTVSGWGFTKNTGTYSKPSSGIPKNDLSEEVQSALVAAEAYKGTVNNITINGSTKSPTNGVVDLGSVGTYSKPSTGIPKTDLASDVQTALDRANESVPRDTYGDLEIIQIQGFDGSLSGMLYALPAEANGDEDDIIATRETLKTINGESVFGSGDITIEGGGSSSGGKEIVVLKDSVIDALEPNKIYIINSSINQWVEIYQIASSTAYQEEYSLIFKVVDNGFDIPFIMLPEDVRWANGTIPSELEFGTLYELSISKTTIGGVNYFNAVLTPFKPV